MITGKSCAHKVPTHCKKDEVYKLKIMKKSDDNVQSNKEGKVQESIQSSTTPDPHSHFQTMNKTSSKIEKDIKLNCSCSMADAFFFDLCWCLNQTP